MAIMNISKYLSRWALASICVFLLYSCGATYQQKTATFQGDLLQGNLDMATAEIDANNFLQKERNRLLYLFEKGKVEHMRGNYEESNRLFEEAYILIDNQIKSSVGQEIAAKLTNPLAEPYKGEDFEKVTLHYYKALNFYQMGMPMEALVEAKRINIKLNELNSRYKKNKNKFTEDAFSQILQGILYEATGDVNNAFIAYRNAAEIYLTHEGSYYGVSLPQQLKYDLLRTADKMGFQNEYSRYSKLFELSNPVSKAHEAEAIIFWENGLGPAKDQTIITASGAGGLFVGSYGEGSIAIPIPSGVNIGINAIAIPYYQQRNSYYHNAALIVDGEEKTFNLAQNFYPIARQCLRDRMMREVVDIAARFVTKKAASAGAGALGKNLLGGVGGEIFKLGTDAIGAATEQADTRNWQTLPATISYVRVPLEENHENIFAIKKYGPTGVDYDTLHVKYRRGLQLVNYFDLGKTTTGFVHLPDTNNVDTSASIKNNSSKYLDSDSSPNNEKIAQLHTSDISQDSKIPENNQKPLYFNPSTLPLDNTNVSDKKEVIDINRYATVYLIRKKKLAGTFVPMPVVYEDQSVVKISDGQFCKFQAEPGNLVLHSNDKGWKSKIMNIEIEPEKTYYILLTAKTGMWNSKAEYSLISSEESQQYLNEYIEILPTTD